VYRGITSPIAAGRSRVRARRDVGTDLVRRLGERRLDGITSAKELGLEETVRVRIARQLRQLASTRQQRQNRNVPGRILIEPSGLRIESRVQLMREPRQQLIEQRLSSCGPPQKL
jgi:hypothetical protein